MLPFLEPSKADFHVVDESCEHKYGAEQHKYGRFVEVILTHLSVDHLFDFGCLSKGEMTEHDAHQSREAI